MRHAASILFHARRRTRAFTLIELLVVIGIIALVGTITVMGFKAVTKDAKLSSGRNAVMAALDNARALAMKNNQPVIVTFVPRLEGEKKPRIDIVFAEWSRITEKVNTTPIGLRTFDRFVLINDAPARSLPLGIGIAGPHFDGGLDDSWRVPTNFAKPNEAPGRAIGVMFGPDGTRMMTNPLNDSDYFWIDFNEDGIQQRVNTSIMADDWYLYEDRFDEPTIELVPFMCVYDDDECRELSVDSDWNAALTKDTEISNYINQYADRIHFNRYTGVAMK